MRKVHLIKENRYDLKFKKKKTAHDVGNVICDVLGFENTEDKYDGSIREYFVYQIIEEKKHPLFSIKFTKKKPTAIDGSKTSKKMFIKVSPNIENFEENIENIINKVNKGL